MLLHTLLRAAIAVTALWSALTVIEPALTQHITILEILPTSALVIISAVSVAVNDCIATGPCSISGLHQIYVQLLLDAPAPLLAAPEMVEVVPTFLARHLNAIITVIIILIGSLASLIK